jgi:hypothetical protein
MTTVVAAATVMFVYYARAKREATENEQRENAANEKRKHKLDSEGRVERKQERIGLNEDRARTVGPLAGRVRVEVGTIYRTFVWQYGFLLNPLLLWLTPPPPKSPSRP